MKRKIAHTKTANAVILMAVERERERERERVVFSRYDFIYNNIINKHIEQKNVLISTF